MKIIWSPFSIERLTEIAKYIENDSPKNANAFIDNIFNEIERLRSFPDLGRFVPELENRNIREIIYDSFRIIYRIDDNRIIILTIRHTKQHLWENEEL